MDHLWISAFAIQVYRDLPVPSATQEGWGRTQEGWGRSQVFTLCCQLHFVEPQCFRLGFDGLVRLHVGGNSFTKSFLISLSAIATFVYNCCSRTRAHILAASGYLMIIVIGSHTLSGAIAQTA